MRGKSQLIECMQILIISILTAGTITAVVVSFYILAVFTVSFVAKTCYFPLGAVRGDPQREQAIIVEEIDNFAEQEVHHF